MAIEAGVHRRQRRRQKKRRELSKKNENTCTMKDTHIVHKDIKNRTTQHDSRNNNSSFINAIVQNEEERALRSNRYACVCLCGNMKLKQIANGISQTIEMTQNITPSLQQ